VYGVRSKGNKWAKPNGVHAPDPVKPTEFRGAIDNAAQRPNWTTGGPTIWRVLGAVPRGTDATGKSGRESMLTMLAPPKGAVASEGPHWI